MTKLPIAKSKLAGLLLVLLTTFGGNARGSGEICSLGSTCADIEHDLRDSIEHDFHRIVNILASTCSTQERVVCLVHSSGKAVAANDEGRLTVARQSVVTALNTTMLQRNAWRGLTPLHSTREEVEKFLGSPKDTVGKTVIYDTQSETVHIWYSEGFCKTSEIGQWDVPFGTVLQIRVYPRAIILLRELQVDMSKYKRLPDPNIHDWAFYKNEVDGVMVQTKLENGCEQVEIITYEPAKKDSKLRCSTTGRKNQ